MRPAIVPKVERCEDRRLLTLVVVLNGASFAATGPSDLTANAAEVLRREGHRVVELATPAIRSAHAYDSIARRLVKMAHGRDLGLVGFSAGGALALRLAATPGLKVRAVLDYYGVPDVRAYLHRHEGDRVYRPIAGLAPFRPSVVARLSGPIATDALLVAAFGRRDPNVRADTSGADLVADHPNAHVYTYWGAHGAPITASRPALEDFLSHL